MTSHIVRTLSFAALALTAACASGGAHPSSAPVQRESLGFDLDGKPWKKVSQQADRATTLTEFVRPEESLASWHEMLTMQSFERGSAGPASAADAQSALRARMLERCPGATWEALRQDSASVLYEWRIVGCAGQDDQHEVARIIDSPRTRMRVAYTYRGGVMPDSVREGWVKRLGEANWEN